MRTNVEIDDKLIEEAQRLTGIKTKRAVVEEGLKTLVRLKKQMRALELGGKVAFWEEFSKNGEQSDK
jgi:Arc/MetJ family transcription regulator